MSASTTSSHFWDLPLRVLPRVVPGSSCSANVTQRARTTASSCPCAPAANGSCPLRGAKCYGSRMWGRWGRWFTLALVLAACAELDNVSESASHTPAAPAYEGAAPPTVDAGEGEADVASEGAGDGNADAADDVIEDLVDFADATDSADAADAAPIVFACVTDAEATDAACKWLVKGSSSPCFATRDQACACLGCPDAQCLASGPRLCLPTLGKGGTPTSWDGGCPPRYVWCGDAAAPDAADQ